MSDPIEPLPPPEPPLPLPAQQVQVQTSDRLVVATGFFPAGSPDPATVEIMDLDEVAWAEFQAAPPGQKYLAEDGTLTVVPPPPPPIEYEQTINVKTQTRTTDDQFKEVFRLPTAVKHIYDAVLKMRAIDAVSGATKVQGAEIVFKRTPSGLIQVGTTQAGPPFQDTAASSWSIQAAPGGTDLVISVKGALGRTVDHLLVGTIDVFAPEGLET